MCLFIGPEIREPINGMKCPKKPKLEKKIVDLPDRGPTTMYVVWKAIREFENISIGQKLNWAVEHHLWKKGWNNSNIDERGIIRDDCISYGEVVSNGFHFMPRKKDVEAYLNVFKDKLANLDTKIVKMYVLPEDVIAQGIQGKFCLGMVLPETRMFGLTVRKAYWKGE